MTSERDVAFKTERDLVREGLDCRWGACWRMGNPGSISRRGRWVES